MGNDLLRILMTICDLGKDWKYLSKLPIDEIIEAWRAQSERGRYESAMWRAAGLEEPNVAQNRSCGGERERRRLLRQVLRWTTWLLGGSLVALVGRAMLLFVRWSLPMLSDRLRHTH